MPRLFLLNPGSAKLSLISVDASQDLQLILSKELTIIVEPCEIVDDLRGNALLLNSPANIVVLENFDEEYPGKHDAAYFICRNPDRYHITAEYRGSYSNRPYRKIVRYP